MNKDIETSFAGRGSNYRSYSAFAHTTAPSLTEESSNNIL